MKHLLFALLLVPQILMAQLNDNFSDGNFAEDPSWLGSDAQFIINPDFQLQLNSTGENTSYLSTPISTSGLTEWRIWTKLAFSPSDNNLARIYLVADQANIAEPLNGYYLKLGESGADDAIELYRQSGTAEYFICRGTNGLIAAAFTLRLRVVRTDEGAWSIYAAPDGGDDFQLQATGQDPTWDTYSHFGVSCKYTSSNAARFYFDDVYAGPAVVDEIKPALLSVEVTGTDQLSLYFSEPVSENSAANVENYIADQQLGVPIAAGRDVVSTSTVKLLFSKAITQSIVYNITVRDVADLAGNIMEPATMPFAFYNVQPFEVLLNEIMADPDPAIGLPAFEYAELYNTSDLPVQLENWKLSIGTTQKTFPRIVLAPKSLLILTSDEAAPLFTSFGNVLSFSSFSLVNTGTTLTLRDANGAIIHALEYTDGWYRDNIKKNGGWSLEQIDPSNPCGGAENWRASNNSSGGSPGTINSINATNADLSAPAIEKISITGTSTVRVFFTEPMDSLSLWNTAHYTVDQGLGSPAELILYPPDYRSVSLVFGGTIAEAQIYTLSLETGFADCAGNLTSGVLTARFAVPSPIDSLDIVINEVLADPRASGTDFVEIYNRSAQVIDLKGLWLATRDATTGELETVKVAAPDGRLMFPGEYLVLTGDEQAVQSEYFTPAPNAFVQMESLPSFPNEAGTVVLLTPALNIIDELTYTAEMQFALLNTTDGVSLERIDFNRSSTDAGNWHSASQNAGFATPGYQNSQFMRAPDSGDEVVITPEIFSPDNDGYNDVLSIACNFAEPGYAVTIRIFDSNGKQVRLLVKNETTGTGNLFTWDGTTDAREKAAIGIYIIHIEVFNLNAKVKQFKKTAVLGGKL